MFDKEQKKTERLAASRAVALVEYVDNLGESMACFDFSYNGGNKDGKTAKVIVIIENEETHEIEN